MEVMSSVDAVDLLVSFEDSVRSAAELAAKPVYQLREHYTLPASSKEWAVIFASRMVMMNKEYRRSVRQALQGYAHHYELLFPRSPEASNPMKQMLSLFVETVHLCNQARALYTEFQGLYRARREASTLLTLSETIVQRASYRMHSLLTKMDEGESSMREQLREWKTCFMVVYMQDHLNHALSVLQSKKITKTSALALCRSLFAELAEVCDQRSEALRQMTTHTAVHSVLFCSAPGGLVSRELVAAKTAKYQELKAVVTSTSERQAKIIDEIHALADTAWATPSTLAGPYGTAIPYDRVYRAGKEFERLRVECSRTQDMARPAVQSFKNMLEHIRNGPAQVIIAVQ